MSETRMKIEEAARHLGVSHRTVRSYIARSLLTTRRISGDRRKWLDPLEVEELRRDRVEGTRANTAELKREVVDLRAGLRRVRAELDLVLRILDMNEVPLQLTPDRAVQLYHAAVQELRSTAWTEEELLRWAEIFLRLQEEDFRVVHAAVGSVPWTPFLRLCVSMIVYAREHKSYTTSLDLQSLHRRLTEARRRLRVSALCYSDLYESREGEAQRELRRAALLDSPDSVREALLRRARSKPETART